MKRRPIRGLALLAIAIFFAAGPSCGVAGKLVSQLVLRFIGPGGLVILCTTLFAMAAVYLGVPTMLVRWTAHLREERRHTQREARRQRRQAVVHVPPAETVEPPAERQQRDRVRAAMKGLGYKPHEFEAFVQQMDATQGTEVPVREGLRKMQQGRVVS